MSFHLSKSDLQAQALNPATPLEALLALAEDYPKEVLSNPVFDLLLVEDPGFLARMSGAAQLGKLWATRVSAAAESTNPPKSAFLS